MESSIKEVGLNNKKKNQIKNQGQIEEIYQFESMFSNLSSRFVELPPDQIDQRIEEGLKLIAEVLKIDRCSVAQLSRNKKELRITHVYAAEGINPLLGVMLNEQQPWYSEQLSQLKPIVMSDIGELPVEADKEKEHCRQQGIQSMVLIPLAVGETFLGVVGFAAIKTKRQWPQKLVKRLNIVGIVFANAIMRKRSDILIVELLKFETMLSDLSARFVKLPAEQIDLGITNGLKLIAEVLKIDRCAVAQLNQKKKELRISHAYSGEDIRSMPDLVINQQQPWLFEQLLQGKSVIMSNINELSPEAINEKEHCRLYGIKSMALIPLIVGDSFLGFVSFAAMKAERIWHDALVQRLKTVGIVFANLIMRKRSEQKLHKALDEINDLKDKLEAENIYLREEVRLQYMHKDFIGKSEAIKNVLNRVEQVANADTTVLLLGETGTGKELAAQTIHNLSYRNRRPMIPINCAALPANLVESELFGHEKGAFTGAHSKRIGRFELADGATIFLDEIGELSLELQAKLLRVLQLNQFERLGGNETIKSDVRVIAATNRDLFQSVSAGSFRMDLYYRLNVFPIVIPPLSSRQEDIPELVKFFVKEFCEKMGKQIEKISQSSMQKLLNYQWPGNIRELKNIIERAMIVTTGSTLRIELPDLTPTENAQMRTYEDAQKKHAMEILNLTNWRIRGKNGAAEILDLKPTTLEAKMKKMGLKRPNR